MTWLNFGQPERYIGQIEEQIRIDQSISLEILKVVNKGEFSNPVRKVYFNTRSDSKSF